ncbi:MAG: hypothetical protein ACYSPJ_07025 [Planctomycetota bacterium]|jgi:hypothetical protein
MLIHKEPQIAPIVTKGFVKRLKFLNTLFKQLGLKGKELESFVLDAVLIDQESKKRRLEKAVSMLDYIISK